MRKILVGMHYINVSQRQWNPSKTSSHYNVPAVDLYGEDTGVDRWKALDGRYKCIGSPSNAATGSGTGYIPIDTNGNPEITELADGNVGYFGCYLCHDTNSHKSGTVYEIGDTMYFEGMKGQATGNHIHAEFFRFDPNNPVLPKRVPADSNKWGSYRFEDYLDPSEFWYATDYSIIKELDGQTFGQTTLADAKGTNTDIDIDIDEKNVVIRIPRDDGYDYRWSVDGNKFGTAYDKTTYKYFCDHNLADEGWEEVAKVNASIFYTFDNATYAEGLEKSRGVNNQDIAMTCVTKFGDTMAIGLDYDGNIIFDKQKNIVAALDTYYGAVTGMFGIMKDGELAEWGKEIESQRNNMYSNISGRTIIGYDATNKQYIIISRQGESGKTGLRGRELFNLCKTNGCTDAICFDGGGSVFLVNNGKDIHTTTRAVKNAIILYRRKKKSDTEITEPSVPEIEPSDKPKDEEGTNTPSAGNDDQSGSGTAQTDSAIMKLLKMLYELLKNLFEK